MAVALAVAAAPPNEEKVDRRSNDHLLLPVAV